MTNGLPLYLSRTSVPTGSKLSVGKAGTALAPPDAKDPVLACQSSVFLCLFLSFVTAIRRLMQNFMMIYIYRYTVLYCNDMYGTYFYAMLVVVAAGLV